MRRLHWVRHGPTHARGMIGWTDLPADLSDTARLARLAAALPAGARLVSSDLARARATADAIAGDRPRLPDMEALREMNFGAWERRAFDEIEAETPELIRAFWDHPGAVRPPGGESWDALCARVDAAVTALCDEHPGDLVICAHMGVILTQVQAALRVDAYTAFGHRIDPLSVTTLAQAPDGWRAERINHLP